MIRPQPPFHTKNTIHLWHNFNSSIQTCIRARPYILALIYNNPTQSRMILEITGSLPRPQSRKLTWKQQLRRSLYRKNRATVERHEQSLFEDKQQLEEAEGPLRKLMDFGCINAKDTLEASNCHSYYSSYVPLQVQTRFDDELALTFPYIKHKAESGRVNDRTLILMEISEYMSQSRKKGEVDAGWQKCLKDFICDIDSIRAAELYLQFKKYGTQRLAELHAQFGGACRKPVFFERVCGAASSFRTVTPLIRSPFSVQSHQELNEITMPKTMKQLFCCICFTYDCNQHSLDDTFKENEYQYLSPKNIKSEEEMVRKAIGICAGYAQLLELGKISGEPCSEGCYRRLGRKEWESLQMNRVRLLSPLVKGVIKLGIDMYSYSPCSICHLLVDQRLTCAHVFLYMVEEHGLMGRLQRKLLASQAQALSREKQNEERILPELARKGKRRIKIAHAEHHLTITSCAHHFRGEVPIDPQCDSCQCRERKYCLPQCLCGDTCPIKKRGCGCKKLDCRTQKCICFSSNAQCDPLICGSCFGEGVKKTCRNHPILSRQFKRVKVGRSTIGEAGLGLFAGEAVQAGEMLMIYTGELIDNSIDLLRESLSVDNSFYNFGSPEGTIDARFMGNPSRFINHANNGEENLYSKNVLTEGRIKVAFYATRDIEEGEELFFDYDGQGLLYKNYKDKYPFIKSKKGKQ